MAGPLETFEKIDGLAVGENVPFSKLTTWKVGGPARFLLVASTLDAARAAVAAARESSLPLLVIGAGSNLLVSDEGYDGSVLRMEGDLVDISVKGSCIEAGAGASIAAVSARASKAGLAGLEFAAGIPGTVGGAVMMNAGAYDGSVGGVLESVEAIGPVLEPLVYESFEDTYRKALVPASDIVTMARFHLRESTPDAVKKLASQLNARRKKAQPLGLPSAGSVFRNPSGGPVGRLIQACGLKGRAVGGARVSELHANFIINEGGATASDILSLIEMITSEVRERFGVDLELEVKKVGFEEE